MLLSYKSRYFNLQSLIPKILLTNSFKALSPILQDLNIIFEKQGLIS